MKHIHFIAPAFVLSGGCALRPFTPSAVLAHWPETVPSPVMRVLPGWDEAMRHWQLPQASPWAAYAKHTLLASLDADAAGADVPDVWKLEVVRRARAAAARVAAAGLPPATMIVVDVRGAGAVAFGTELSRLARAPVACVPTFNNWPAEYELVPAEETLAAMIAMPPTQPPDALAAGATPVFLLDAWRLAYRDLWVDDDYVDNRYFLGTADLPDGGALRDRGIRRVLYVVETLDETTLEEDDLNATMLAWQDAGVAISMLDLDQLAQLDNAAWDRVLGGAALVVKHRPTLLDDREFYARARSGFGGVHAGPSPFRTAIGFHIGGGGAAHFLGGAGGGFGGHGGG